MHFPLFFRHRNPLNGVQDVREDVRSRVLAILAVEADIGRQSRVDVCRKGSVDSWEENVPDDKPFVLVSRPWFRLSAQVSVLGVGNAVELGSLFPPAGHGDDVVLMAPIVRKDGEALLTVEFGIVDPSQVLFHVADLPKCLLTAPLMSVGILLPERAGQDAGLSCSRFELLPILRRETIIIFVLFFLFASPSLSARWGCGRLTASVRFNGGCHWALATFFRGGLFSIGGFLSGFKPSKKLIECLA